MKILISGLGGSGKTTYAIYLGNLLGVEVVHADYFHANNNQLKRKDRTEYLRQKSEWMSEQLSKTGDIIYEGNSFVKYANSDVRGFTQIKLSISKEKTASRISENFRERMIGKETYGRETAEEEIDYLEGYNESFTPILNEYWASL
jgi:cytidylate kinase